MMLYYPWVPSVNRRPGPFQSVYEALPVSLIVARGGPRAGRAAGPAAQARSASQASPMVITGITASGGGIE